MWSIDLTSPIVTSEPVMNLAEEYFMTTNKVQSIEWREANNVYNFTLKRDIVRYVYRATGSPVPATWIKSINNGNYATWPGLTSQLVRKHLPKSDYTTKGHTRQDIIRPHLVETMFFVSRGFHRQPLLFPGAPMG